MALDAQVFLPGFSLDGKGKVQLQDISCDVDAMMFGTTKPNVLQENPDSSDISEHYLFEGFEGIVEFPEEASLIPGAGASFNFWLFISPPYGAPQTKIRQWDTLRWSTTDYSCRGDMWINQLYTAVWYNASGIPDSMVHGRSYWVEAQTHYKPEYAASWTVNGQRQLVEYKNYYLQAWDDTTFIPYCEWKMHWEYDSKGRLLRRVRSLSTAKVFQPADTIYAHLRPYGLEPDAQDWYDLEHWMRDTLRGGGVLEWFELHYKEDQLVEALHYDESWAQVCLAAYTYTPSKLLSGIQRFGGDPFRLFYDRKGRLERFETDLRIMASDAGPYTVKCLPKYSKKGVLIGFQPQWPEQSP